MTKQCSGKRLGVRAPGAKLFAIHISFHPFPVNSDGVRYKFHVVVDHLNKPGDP